MIDYQELYFILELLDEIERHMRLIKILGIARSDAAADPRRTDRQPERSVSL